MREYNEATNSGFARDPLISSGYYCRFAMARLKGYTSDRHLSENYVITWNELPSGIVWQCVSR